MTKKSKAKTTAIVTVIDTLASIEVSAAAPEPIFKGFEEAEAALEAATVVLETSAPAVPAIEAPVDDRDFKVILASFPEAEVAKTIKTAENAIASRRLLEIAKNPENSNILRTLKNANSSMARRHAAMVMLAANVDPQFVNRSLKDGEHYNVYAIGKFSDLVDALTGLAMKNAINIAVVRTLFNFKKAGLDFTTEMAKAAASDKIRVEPKFRKHIISHTVSASTAPTQSSSTLQALETLGIIRVTGMKGKHTYAVTNTPAARALEALAMGTVAIEELAA